MKTYEQAEIQHAGKSEHRLGSNPHERVFSDAWKREQRQSHVLQWLLCVCPDQSTQDRDLTQPEATCAATLMQWLGSPVGWCWLNEALRECGYRLVSKDHK